jgi:hypothetical protein
MPKPKDPKKKMKVKGRALERGPLKNDIEFEKIMKSLLFQKSLPKEKRDTDDVIICRVENMEGTGNFHLWSKEGREYFGACPGNLVLESMIGQLVKQRIPDISGQPLVLVVLINGKTEKKPEILALISDIDPVIKQQRMSLLKEVGIEFVIQDEDYEFDREDVPEADIEFDDL